MFKLSDENVKYYEILNKLRVEEYDLEMYELKHKVTKAKILLFDCDDENRVFNIAFKTPVENSKGTPHILEHSVLCGSRKYNIKDPFIELAKGSMNTFLNAITFPDKTCYPVASANIKDFHNLVDVYLDAVFYPNVCKNKKIFLQEGWHYEIEDAKAPLKVNGVVYNEMKGVYSDPDSILMSSVQKSLYRGTNYAYESGGKPEDIINLSYEEFVKFHDTYYSASNSIICFYGKLDFNYELEYLQNEYLKDMNYVDCNPKFISCDKNLIIPESVDYYNCDDENTKDKTYIAYTFLLGKTKDKTKNLMLSIIDDYLFDDNTGILKEKLLRNGYGMTISSGYEMSENEGYYSIAVQNINEDKKEELIKIIDDTFNVLYEKGFDKDTVDGALNSMYFEALDMESSRPPKGLSLILSFITAYLYGVDYSNVIGYKKCFDYAFSMDLNDKSNLLFTTLKESFIDNEFKCVNILRPKFGLLKENENKLSNILSDRKKVMKEDDINKIIEENRNLLEYQSKEDTVEAKKCIPSLHIEDFDRYKEYYTYKVEKKFGIDIVIDEKITTDIVYFSLVYNVDNVNKEDIYFLSLILELMHSLDTVSMGYKDFYNYASKHLGAIVFGFNEYNDKYYFEINVKTTIKNINKAFDIVYRYITEILFNNKERIEMFINEAKISLYNNILSSGHTATLNRANSKISKNYDIKDKISKDGIAEYQFIKDIANSYNDNSELYNDILTNLYKKFTSGNFVLFTSLNKTNSDNFISEFKNFYDKLKKYRENNNYIKNDEEKLKELYNRSYEYLHFDDYEMKGRKEAIITTNDINFCSMAGKYDKNVFKGNVIIMLSLLNYDYLWNNIRVKGGAYGCGSIILDDGLYGFYSYRDPNLINTYNIYKSVKDYIVNLNLSNEDLNKAIIGAMAIFDNPKTIGKKFIDMITSYYENRTNEKFNKYRLEVLDTKIDDLKKLSVVYKDIDENNYKCALISEKNKEEAKKEFDVIWELKQ